jgi:hypothetical protein
MTFFQEKQLIENPEFITLDILTHRSNSLESKDDFNQILKMLSTAYQY